MVLYREAYWSLSTLIVSSFQDSSYSSRGRAPDLRGKKLGNQVISPTVSEGFLPIDCLGTQMLPRNMCVCAAGVGGGTGEDEGVKESGGRVDGMMGVGR